MKVLKSPTRTILALVIAAVSLIAFNTPTIVSALPESQKKIFERGILYHDYNQAVRCSTVGIEADETAGTNTDYAGNQVLSDAQFTAIKENQSFYEAAASDVGIPWQMIAVIHLRETGLKRVNPANGQGIYQFVSKQGGPYPSGAVDDTEFARQTKIAAEFIKGKAASNVQQNRTLDANATPEAVKDTFFSYNGRSAKYADQAASLGYDRSTQPYEGSPYVMNRADEKRDPAVNKTTWGQVKRDFGPIEYPANNDYGAFVVYAALAGIAPGGNCSNAVNGTVREKVVAIAKQELELWKSGQLKPGGDFKKYTGGASANWCAWFSSWVYNQAGYPISESAPEGRVPAVTSIWDIGKAGGRFNFHAVGSGYTPRPGDLVIQKNNASHVNIVVAVEGNRITVIGGNQGGSGDMNGYYLRSSVTQYTMDINHAKNTGFVSPD